MRTLVQVIEHRNGTVSHYWSDGLVSVQVGPNAWWCVKCQGVVVTQPNGLPKKVHTPECNRGK